MRFFAVYLFLELEKKEQMMKNVTTVLALMAVLAMAGTTLADVGLSGNLPGDGTDLGNGLTSYTLTVNEETAVFGFVSITDGVHQSNLISPVWDPDVGAMVDQVTPTVFLPSMPPTLVAVDTHFLFPDTAGLGVGITETEGNDKSDPAGVADYGYFCGIGEFEMVGGFTFASALAPGADFMQIVLPTGGLVMLDFTMPVEGANVDFSIPVGVPEPSTILMLIAGGLCLLAIRFRK